MTFDLEKARDVAGFMIVHNCYGGERFADTLAEVERLRADLRNCSAYVGIGPGEGDLPIPERVRRTVNRLNGSVHRYEQKILAKDVQIRSLKIEETNLTGQIEQLEAEIERLRAASIEYQNALDDVQNLKEQIETLHLRRENELRQMNEISWQNKTQAARIQELEDALVEERAKQFDVDEPCPARTHHEYCNILKGLCDGFPHMWEQCPRKPEKLDAARQQLQAEGKIGPDAKPRSWQITDERKAAIRTALLQMGESPFHTEPDEDVLRAVLKEAT